jgi:hypothetical protein
MKLVAAATLWCLFSAWLIFGHVGVARMLRTAVASLMWVQFGAVLVWSFGTEDCVRHPCAPLAEAGRSAATIDLPALSAVVLALVVADGIRRRRAALAAPHARR